MWNQEMKNPIPCRMSDIKQHELTVKPNNTVMQPKNILNRLDYVINHHNFYMQSIIHRLKHHGCLLFHFISANIPQTHLQSLVRLVGNQPGSSIFYCEVYYPQKNKLTEIGFLSLHINPCYLEWIFPSCDQP